jgi:hypothetical protein
MKRFESVFLLGMILVSSLCSQEIESAYVARNAINIYPFGPIFGNININYEHLFGKANGLMVQALLMEKYGFSSATGFSVELQYRRHYFRYPKQKGLNSPFWGPFIYYEMSRTQIAGTNGSKYDVDITFGKAGANWGRRWIWGKSFNLALRIGAGIPFYANYNWLPYKPDQYQTIEALSIALACFDGELTIGFAF